MVETSDQVSVSFPNTFFGAMGLKIMSDELMKANGFSGSEEEAGLRSDIPKNLLPNSWFLETSAPKSESMINEVFILIGLNPALDGTFVSSKSFCLKFVCLCLSKLTKLFCPILRRVSFVTPSLTIARMGS